MERSLRYSGISTINHWLTVVLIFSMLVLGLVADEAPGDAAEDYIMSVHISLGFFTLLFVAWRIAFRLYEGFPQALGQSRFEQRFSALVQRTLLLAMLTLVLTGPLYLFTEGEALNVFGWFSISIPLTAWHGAHEAIEEVHEVTATYILPLLLSLHVAGAIRLYLKPEDQSTIS